MSQLFNLSRFGRLLRKHTTEHFSSYLLQAAALFGGLLLVIGGLSYLMHSPPSQTGQAVLYFFGLMGSGFFFASAAFREYGAGRQAATALTLPASQLEKYLVAWFYSLPVFLVVFTATFFAADWLVMELSALRGPGGQLINPMEGGKDLRDILFLYLLVHSVALWGSIYFRKLQLVKTACAGLAALVLLFVGNYAAMNLLLATKVQFSNPFGSVVLPQGRPIFLPADQTLWLPLLPLALAALLWVAAYFRLTEKQL